MKLSLAWIFDHIHGSWKAIDVTKLIEKFNVTIAEVDCAKHITFVPEEFSLVRVDQIKGEQIIVFDFEHQTVHELPLRSDAKEGDFFILKKENNAWRWAQLTDWFSSKSNLISAVSCQEKDRAGGWKKELDTEDWIIEIENKSITHRPDLWGQRGMAREIATLAKMDLVDENSLFANVPVQEEAATFTATAKVPFSSKITNRQVCDRFSFLSIPAIESVPSNPAMAFRLARVDARPIDFIVDATNYVMLETGQPIHAFDAQTITKSIEPVFAQAGEKLTLLDGEQITLTNQDLVIADGTHKPLALAGVMGGKATGVTQNTKSLLVESAHFDATTIRLTATRHKKRTDASARFEKNIDPMGNVNALRRFAFLLEKQYASSVTMNGIVSLGAPTKDIIITVKHNFLQERVGVTFDSYFVIETLTKLGFGVRSSGQQDAIEYHVDVPAYRRQHIHLPEDILEEVVRFYGFEHIVPQNPTRPMLRHKAEWVYKKRLIKNMLAFSFGAREVNNYNLYDEDFLQKINYMPHNAAAVKNPVSDRAFKLVTSLMPHLLKNIEQNKATQSHIRLFEWNRCWHKKHNEVIEKQMVAGIVYQKDTPIDFYQMKYEFSKLFDALSFSIEWHKASEELEPWFHRYQTAQLLHNGVVIGNAGMVSPAFLHSVTEGNAFIFEFDAQQLIGNNEPVKKFVPLSKFPKSSFDISMLIPLATTTRTVIDAIKQVDARIVDVDLIDFFEKEAWLEHRSITVRCAIQDEEKTLTKEDIDAIYQRITALLIKQGAQIR